MKEFKSSATIQASPEKIWEILTDIGAYPEWDPYCVKIEGELEVGNKIKAFSTLSPGRAFAVKVKELVPNQKMTWQGGMPLGLFKGVRTFTLTPAGDKTQFDMHEVFSGPMMVLIGGTIPDMSDAFDKFALGLKQRAEAS
jgi:hypothetical protein